MKNKIVSAETMEVGKKGGGKHWTDAQVSARKKAAESIKRKNVDLSPPVWLSKGALLIWERVVSDAAKIDLLDNLDRDLLGTHCDAVDIYQTLSHDLASGQSTTRLDDMKMLQGWARIISGTAEKLGFTPSARARLVKKIADESLVDEFGDKFDK